jgi:AraC-like DNA-binding protein
MRLAQRQGVQSMGPVAILFRHAETVADALDGVCRYLYHCAPPDIAKLERNESTAVITLEIALRQMAFRDHWIEKGLALTMEAFRLMLGDDFAPIRVTMQHRAMSQGAVYREVFKCPVDFACEHNAIHFPLSLLSRPIAGRDPTILALAENYLSQISGALPLVEHVQELIHRMLKIDQASLVSVAQAMIVHPRVLQRRLAEQGTSFEAILDSVRREMAWQLSGRINRVSQIATMLGYAEQSVYSRACRRWYGKTPRQLIALRQTHSPTAMAS